MVEDEKDLDKENSNSKENVIYSCDYMEFNRKLTELIEYGNLENVKDFMISPKSTEEFIKYPYEILEAVVPYLRLDQSTENTKKYEIQNCSKEVLFYMANVCSASELLMFMIEHLEQLKSDDAYFLFLEPLRICLCRSRNCSLMIDICFDNILENLISSTKNKEQNTIISNYANISNFVDNLYNDLHPELKNDTLIMQMKTKYLIVDFLLSLFGKPIAYINLSGDQIESIFPKIYANLLTLEYDIFYFFRFIKYGNLYKYCLSSGPQISLMNFYNSSDNKIFSLVTDLSLCNFYWITLCQKSDLNFVHVYHPYYIAYNCINIANFFLSDSEGRNIMLVKASDLITWALKILSNYLIPSEALDLPIHNELLKNLANCIIYGPLKYQKKMLDNFISYIHQFEIDAKYFVIKNIIRSNVYHTKIIGVVIGVLKDTIDKISLSKDNNNKNKTFLQENLQFLISQICHLENGIETDLAEISDQLISTLNLIIFVLIRKGTNNSILNVPKEAINKYVSVLKLALEKQKVEWRKTISDAHNKSRDDENKNQFSIKGLPQPTKEEEILMSEKAMNILLVIENLLVRIEDLQI